MNSKQAIGAFIAFLMIASIFGVTLDYFATGGGSTLEYNDREFRVVNGQYVTVINDEPYAFNLYPADIEYITLDENARAVLASPVLTITYNPNTTLASSFAEAQYYLEFTMQGKTIVERALTNSTGTELSERTCKDATPAQPVILLQESNESSLATENNCITINALDQYDTAQYAERLAYHFLKIIP